VCGAFGTFAHQAYAACLRGPVSSNVRPRRHPLWRYIPRVKASSLALLLIALAAQAEVQASTQCFSLFDPKNKLVYQSTDSLVDLSRSISEQVAAKYPGHHLVITPASYCPEVDERPSTRALAKPMDGAARTTYESPLLDLADDTTSSDGSSPAASARGNQEPGKDVRVRTYRRGNGTVVQSHTRAAPGKGAPGTRR
jgi:hypothetical protein